MEISSRHAMKTKYLFCFTATKIDEATVFVDVYIGTGKQDQRDLTFFVNLAANSNFYFFEKYDLRVTEFRNKIEIQLANETQDERFRLLTCSMSAGKLRRLLKSGLYDEWARTFYCATRGLRRMNLSKNSAYFCAVNRADTTIANPLT